MDKKFIVTPADKSITITIRISEQINNQLETISNKSGHSRNSIINQALKFALDNLQFIDENNGEIKTANNNQN